MAKGELAIRFDWPLGGWDQNNSNTNQKRGTTRSAMNVLPYDSTQKRARGGQRPGLTKALTGGPFTGTAQPGKIRALTQVTRIVKNDSGGAGFDANQGDYRRQVQLVACIDDTAFLGTGLGALVAATGGPGVRKVQACLPDLFGKCYVVDGNTNVQILNLDTGAMTNLVATAGAVPTTCSLGVAWRGRLVLAGSTGDPQNVQMSKVGDPTDWLYGQTNATSAFELNSGLAGKIGQPVTCLIPFRDDTLIIGQDHAIDILQGDPSSNGQLVHISDAVGITSQTSWCYDPEGNIYFVGSGGFYKMGGDGGQPQCLSAGRLDSFFTSIDKTRNLVLCVFDRDRRRVWIFLTLIATNASTHVVYDVRTDSFWQQQFTTAEQGPLSAIVYDGDGPNDRVTLLGGRDGYVRKLDPAATSDDGTLIAGTVTIGPVFPGGDFDEAMIRDWQITPGGGTNKMIVKVQTGRDAETAAAAAATTLATLTAAGRQNLFTRVRGACFFLSLSNDATDKTFNLESLVAIAEPSGVVR